MKHNLKIPPEVQVASCQRAYEVCYSYLELCNYLLVVLLMQLAVKVTGQVRLNHNGVSQEGVEVTMRLTSARVENPIKEAKPGSGAASGNSKGINAEVLQL